MIPALIWPNSVTNRVEEPMDHALEKRKGGREKLWRWAYLGEKKKKKNNNSGNKLNLLNMIMECKIMQYN